MMLKFTWLTLIVLSFPNKLAISVDYRSWYTPAQNTYKRGKSVYEDIIKSANDREEECVILHSSDRQLATMQYGTGSGGQFPCINQLQRGSNRSLFDINANVDEMAGPTRKDRVIAEGGCWQFVLNQINALDIDKCDIKGEVSRSLIALAKTKCHFIRSRRAFPLAEHGCILNPESVDDKSLGIFNEEYETNPCRNDYSSAECRKLKEDIVAQCTNLRIMSESAFQMYHADLNHIDDICFYLQSNDWNRRTESNINKLGESASTILYKHHDIENMLETMRIEHERNLDKANEISKWMESLEKDIKSVFRILNIIRSYQRIIIEFIHNFKMVLLYMLYILLAVVFTVFDATAWARPRIILAIATACSVDTLLYKWITSSKLIEQLPYSKDEICTTTSKSIRYTTLLYSTITWVRAVLNYQAPAEAMLREMHQIRKILTPRVIYTHVVTESDDEGTDGTSAKGYTLDDFVELFGDESDSDYTYVSGYTSEDSVDDSLGEDSDGLVNEYLESRRRRRR